MAFGNFNNSNNNNQGGGNEGEKKKTNFKIAKMWGADGALEISIWVTDTGVKTILTPRAAIGKDPSTGANVLEQKMNSELPRFFLGADRLRAIIDATEGQDVSTLNVVLDTINGSKLTIVGSQTAVKITIDTTKNGTRTITFDAITINGKNIHASFTNFIEYLKIAYKKTIYNKLDADEFGMVVGNNEEDLPI